jgi:lysophospholipase L1-like esterase
MGQLWLVIIFITALVIISFLASRDKKKKIIFFGDSITQAGTEQNGYITVLNKMMHQHNIHNYQLISAGIGGNKVNDLLLRMDDDVLRKLPYMVIIFIGVNDVWHKKTKGGGTAEDKFEEVYNIIVSKIVQIGTKVVLCTPAVIGEKYDGTNELDEDLNRYCNIVRNIAAYLHLPLVDIRKAFIDYEMKHNTANASTGILTVDGVHLNDKGNELVAEEMWSVMKNVKGSH